MVRASPLSPGDTLITSVLTEPDSEWEMGTKLIFVGVDGEMTGTDRENFKHRLCQIGVAFDMRTTFVSDIGWGPSNYEYEEAALAVNGFDTDRIEMGPSKRIVDELLCPFLEVNGGNPEKKILIPVGFNVGPFDMPFIKDALPNSWRYFSRRQADLNSMCFQLDGQIKYQGEYPTWKGWKRLSKAYAREQMENAGIEGAEHDARYDAIMAILCFEFLRNVSKRD